MKKTLLLLASAALLLVGCVKEQVSNGVEGGMTEVTFTASLDNGVATKADADNDGDGTNVNRCIMEIYFQNQFYKRMVQSVTPAAENVKAYATFSNVPVVAGKQYQILFWADCGGAENADKYYTTNTTNKGLTEVAIKHDAFINALENGKNDELDAFFAADNYTVPQAGGNYGATLKRPFAQLNVITTDLGAGKTVTCAGLLPEKDSVSYKAADKFNVATGEISSSVAGGYTYSYEAPVYGTWSSTKTELTLSMDYILASTEQAAVDVTFITKNGGQAVMTHSLANLPYKRNYRTNVKGDLLTVGGSWTATIDAQWLSPDIVKVVEVADIKSANEIIRQYAETTKNLEVKFVGVPNDSGVPTGVAGSGSRAILTSPLQQGASLSIEVMTSTNTLYVGDYINEYKVTGETEDDYIDNTAKQATVNINVPTNSGIGTLIINAPYKSVYINGKQVASVGTITNLDAITSQNTLIIEKGQTVDTLTIRQGGLEIHGTVVKAIVPGDHGLIAVRDCENLNETYVYNVLKDHIAEGYVGVKDRTTAGKWDIVPIVCKIGEIGYGSLADAVAAVPETGVETTITMVANHEILGNAGVTVKATQNIILDLAGYTVKNLVNENKASQVILNNGTLTVKNEGKITNAVQEGAQPGEWWSTPQYNYASNVITNNGTLIVDGAEIFETAAGSICFAIDNNSSAADAICTIKSGYVHKDSGSAVRMFCNSTTKMNTINVEGGLIEGGYTGIWLQLPGSGQAKKKAKLNISGGTLKGGTYAWYDYTYGDLFDEVKVTISGGLLDGEIFSYGTNIDISGGVFTSDVNIEQTKPSTISVTGGKFSGDVNAYGNSATEKFISGGVFEAEPYDGFVADGYAVVANTDDTTKDKYPWTVEAQGQAKIGGVVYPTLEDAVAAAVQAGSGTIELLPAYIESGRYPQAWITSPCVDDDVPDGMSSTYTFHAFNPDNGDEEIYNKCSVDMSTQTINTDALDTNEKARVDAILAECNDYLSWPCDYEVFFDDANDANVSIQGNYALFGWTPCDIEQALSGEHQRLLLTMLGESWAAQFNYTAMLGFVNQFHCGLSNDEPAKNAGKTFSVELYMYHPENENVKILISKTDYKFPQVSE